MNVLWDRKSLCYNIHCSWHLKIAFLHSSLARINWSLSVCICCNGKCVSSFIHTYTYFLFCTNIKPHKHTHKHTLIYYKHPVCKLIILFNAKNSVVATRKFIVVRFFFEALFSSCLTRFIFYLIAIQRVQHIDFSVNK